VEGAWVLLDEEAGISVRLGRSRLGLSSRIVPGMIAAWSPCSRYIRSLVAGKTGRSRTTLDLIVDLISHMLYFCQFYALAADGARRHKATQLVNPLRIRRSGSRAEQ
jgi:hypothetical protein